jgi:hypothetical protein
MKLKEKNDLIATVSEILMAFLFFGGLVLGTIFKELWLLILIIPLLGLGVLVDVYSGRAEKLTIENVKQMSEKEVLEWIQSRKNYRQGDIERILSIAGYEKRWVKIK